MKIICPKSIGHDVQLLDNKGVPLDLHVEEINVQILAGKPIKATLKVVGVTMELENGEGLIELVDAATESKEAL